MYSGVKKCKIHTHANSKITNVYNLRNRRLLNSPETSEKFNDHTERERRCKIISIQTLSRRFVKWIAKSLVYRMLMTENDGNVTRIQLNQMDQGWSRAVLSPVRLMIIQQLSLSMPRIATPFKLDCHRRTLFDDLKF